MKTSQAVAMACLIGGCVSPSDVALVDVVVGIEGLELHMVEAGAPGDYLIRITAVTVSADQEILPSERVPLDVSSDLGDRETARLGPAECADGPAVYDCHRFTVVVGSGVDRGTLRRQAAELGVYLLGSEICSEPDDCSVQGAIAIAVVADASELSTAMTAVSDLSGVDRVERSVNGSPLTLGSPGQRLETFLPASPLEGQRQGDRVLLISEHQTTEVTVAGGGQTMFANLQAPASNH